MTISIIGRGQNTGSNVNETFSKIGDINSGSVNYVLYEQKDTVNNIILKKSPSSKTIHTRRNKRARKR